MRLLIPTLALAAAFGLAGGSALAQTAKPQSTSAKQTSAPAKATTPAKPAAAKPAHTNAMRASGKLSAFDAGSKMLTLMTSKGNQEFMLAASTKIEEGSKTIDPDALQKLTGRNITVSYMESGGHRTVQSVHVSAPAHTTAPKKS